MVMLASCADGHGHCVPPDGGLSKSGHHWSCSFSGPPVREGCGCGCGCGCEGRRWTELPFFPWDEDGGLYFVLCVPSSDVSQPFPDLTVTTIVGGAKRERGQGGGLCQCPRQGGAWGCSW